jgi:hypothetical protein
MITDFRSARYARRLPSLRAYHSGRLRPDPECRVCRQHLCKWPNGPPQNPNFFPISVWWQNPAVTGNSGSYSTIGAAAAGMGINIFLGEGNWPESIRR